MRKFLSGFWALVLLILPEGARAISLPAQTGVGTGGRINTAYLSGYANSIIYVINSILVPVLMAIAFIVFLYGIFKYFILHGAEEEERKEGRQYAIWGIIGFVVIFTIWGLVNLVGSTLGLYAGGLAPLPPKL